MISASFVPNLAPLPSFMPLYQKVSVVCHAMSILISACLISYANYGGTFLVLGLGLGLYLSDASLNMADNSNALGLILPPVGGSISTLFDLLCKLMGTLCYSVQMKSCHSFHLRNSCFKKLSKKFFPCKQH